MLVHNVQTLFLVWIMAVITMVIFKVVPTNEFHVPHFVKELLPGVHKIVY